VKVVLFCGGRGLRMREHSESVPKPMVPIGYRPVLWHLMKYYAHYGHKEFILCLGYQADVIKSYFLSYQEEMSNDFVLDGGNRQDERRVTLLASDVHDWRITFVDTGLDTVIGERLMRVREHLAGEDCFLANYADVVTDAPLDKMIAQFEQQEAVALNLSVKPNYTFHFTESDEAGWVTRMQDVQMTDMWINGGFFVLSQRIFDYMEPGDELVVEPFQRLVAERKLATFRHNGFWAPMDSLKEKTMLDEMYHRGERPWWVWSGDAA
jgi:glucose-1-phosphate cytidylyltransferase